jgi:hypothetical protein
MDSTVKRCSDVVSQSWRTYDEDKLSDPHERKDSYVFFGIEIDRRGITDIHLDIILQKFERVLG